MYINREKNGTIANKAYVICCELGYSIKELAELRNTRRPVPKSTTSRSYQISDAIKKAVFMKKPLEAMYKILDDYRYKLEQGRAHVEAFVFDSFAYNDSYFNASTVSSSTKQLKDINTIIEDVSNQKEKRYRDINIVDLLGYNSEER